ncbi:MAG: zinc protease [Bacteroides sp. SM23_62]|nr:MAG: zinc protease [Bacteroides sp. SM23_62]
MSYETFTLDNGIRLIHNRVPSLVAHLGLIMGTGSRDELDHEHGMAHFFEHMVFKGTQKRKAYHILSRMEDVGGEINAYTTKEETCVYASFMREYYGRAIELLEDILFHSTFHQKEIGREKEVIIDEINSYFDSPGELIFDDFEEQLYKGQSIGRNILGSPESLSRFKQEDLLRFVSHNYHTDEMVICSVGNISFPRLIKGIEKYFGQVPLKSRNQKRPGILPYEPADATVKKDTYQAHCIIGNMAYDLNDDRRLGLHLLNNMIGGPGLNTRLNMTLREKNGYSYHTESHYSPYSDTGILSVYFSGDKSKLEQSKKVVMKEFSKLREKRLGTLQLSRAKRQLMGQIAISAENHETLMLSMAKSYLVYNKFDDLKEISIKIDRITAEEIMEIANEVLDRVNLSSLTYI